MLLLFTLLARIMGERGRSVLRDTILKSGPARYLLRISKSPLAAL